MPRQAIALMSPDEEYKLLPDSPAGVEENDDAVPPNSHPFAADRRRLRAIIVVQSTLIALLLVALAWIFSHHWTGRSVSSPHLHVYSPANIAVEYEDVVFVDNFHPSNVYIRYPSDEVDKAWTDLYNQFGVLQIPKPQALSLANKTLPIPADPDNHIVSISVFHQLHCLNKLRKALYLDYYVDPMTGDFDGSPKEETTNHINHCIDLLRQGIMCASDTSPIVFQWDAIKNKALPRINTLHTCRKFDRIVDWAKAHTMQHHFDSNVRVDGA